MKQIRDCTDPATWWPHLDEAHSVLSAGGLIVMPTDTVYGVAADAFSKLGVDMLLAAKRRGRNKPTPVLVGEKRTALALAADVSEQAQELMDKFWPGPLTIVVTAQPSLTWDLGETDGTVALRMPAHECALALLRKTGPLAVSSANRSEQEPARTALAAHRALGSSARIYLDAGPAGDELPSTIVDATGPTLRILREGALSAEELGITPEVEAVPETEASLEVEAVPETEASLEVEAVPETEAVASSTDTPSAGSDSAGTDSAESLAAADIEKNKPAGEAQA